MDGSILTNSEREALVKAYVESLSRKMSVAGKHPHDLLSQRISEGGRGSDTLQQILDQMVAKKLILEGDKKMKATEYDQTMIQAIVASPEFYEILANDLLGAGVVYGIDGSELPYKKAPVPYPTSTRDVYRMLIKAVYHRVGGLSRYDIITTPPDDVAKAHMYLMYRDFTLLSFPFDTNKSGASLVAKAEKSVNASKTKIAEEKNRLVRLSTPAPTPKPVPAPSGPAPVPFDVTENSDVAELASQLRVVTISSPSWTKPGGGVNQRTVISLITYLAAELADEWSNTSLPTMIKNYDEAVRRLSNTSFVVALNQNNARQWLNMTDNDVTALYRDAIFLDDMNRILRATIFDRNEMKNRVVKYNEEYYTGERDVFMYDLGETDAQSNSNFNERFVDNDDDSHHTTQITSKPHPSIDLSDAMAKLSVSIHRPEAATDAAIAHDFSTVTSRQPNPHLVTAIRTSVDAIKENPNTFDKLRIATGAFCSHHGLTEDTAMLMAQHLYEVGTNPTQSENKILTNARVCGMAAIRTAATVSH